MLLDCSVCGRTLPTSEFTPRPDRPRGFVSRCRECDRKKSRRYYEANFERKLARYAELKAANTSPPRKCLECERPATSRRHWFCDECRERGGRRRMNRQTLAKSGDRGYDYAHQKLRRRWDREVQLGGVRCARCGLPIVPGTPWDLGHHDEDRSRYNGPEHARCNRGASNRERRTSRRW